MSKKAARMRVQIMDHLNGIHGRDSVRSISSVLDIAVEVIMNGPGTPDYRDGVIDFLSNLCGAAHDGDIVFRDSI